ncbi:MAG: PAS domain S-box protein [Magnetococcales bacterium]|nr:PAS domain S-box protein [Magnetococcales bacterium]
MLIITAILWLRNSRSAHEDLAMANIKNFTQTLEYNIALSFERINHALLSVADEVLRQTSIGKLDGAAINAFLERQENRLGVNSMLLSNSQGHLMHGRLVRENGATSIADRDYFLRARDNSHAGLLISKPLTGRLSGIDQIVVARRIDNHEGNFLGVIFSSISLKQFTDQFSELNLGPNGIVTLRDQDAALIARHPPLTGPKGQPGSVAISAKLKHIRSSGQKEAIYMATSPTDGINRLNAYRTIRETGLFLIVSKSQDDILADWHKDVWHVIGFGLVVLAIITVTARKLILAKEHEENFLQQLSGANAALRNSEERYRLISENMVDLICLHAPDSSFIYVSPSMTTMMGYTQEEILGKFPADFHHPDDVERIFKPSYQKVAIDRQHDHLTQRIRAKDGHYVWLDTVVKPILNADGQILHIQSVSRNVTEREEIEKTLREERDFIRAMINALPGVFYVISHQGRFHLWNKKLEEVSGLGHEEMAASSPADLFRGTEREYIAERIQEVFSKGFATAEASIVAKDGTVTPHYFVGHYIEQDGKPFLIGMGLDISERKSMENALHQAKEAAESASRVKSDFLATMSHEIRTPMNVVIGMGDVLIDSGINDEQKGYVLKLQGAGNNLLDLINQILDFSKIEAGQLHIVQEPVDLHAGLHEVSGMLRLMVENKGVQLDCIIDEAVPQWVISDRLRLHQVLLNLLSNALKFTEQGTITLREKLDDPDTLHVMVEDTGIGIEEAQLETIFEVFAQSDSSITRRYGGTGLGLAISRKLVDLMGGRIWVESRPGKGSTFHVRLPIRTAAPPDKSLAPTQPVDIPGGIDLAMRILLVEDSEDNQVLIRTFLKNTRHWLTVVADGKEAVEIVQEETFDLVFMDIQMPVMDGYTATRLIRQMERNTGRKALPIVALTAHALNGEEERSQEAGCDLYLSKPIKKQHLLEVIQQIGVKGI